MAGQASDVAARDARDELRLNAATGLVFDALAGRSRTSAHKPDSRSMRVYRCHHSSTYRLVLTLVAVVHMSLVLLEPPSGSRTVPVAPGQPPLQYTSTTALEAAVLLCYALDIALQARYAGVRTYLSARWNVVEVLVTLVFLADVLSTATGLVKVQFSRALRPIFVITKRRHVRFLVTGIAQAVPALAPLLLLAVASMAVFSFVGVLLLSGSSGLFPDLASDPSAFPPGCTPFVPPHEPAPGNLSVLPGGIVPPRDVACEDYFSSIGLALYTMFNLFNKTAWPNAMIPFLERHPVSALFFVVFMLVGHFLLFRLLVAVAFASFSESANVRLRRQATHSRAAVLRAYRLLADLDTGFVSLQAFRALAARVRPSVPSEVYDIVFRAVGGDCGLLGPNAFVAACRLLDVRARPVPGARRAGSALMRIFRAAAGSDEADDEGNDGGGGDGGGPRKGPRRRAWEQSGGWGGGEDEDDEDDEDDLLGHELTREAGDDNDDLTVAPSLVAAAVSGPNRLDVGGPRHSVSPGGAARASRRGAGSPGRVPSFRLRRPSASGAGGRCCGRGRQARLTSTRRHGCLGALRDASDDARRPVRRLLRSAVGETATVLLVLVAATVEVVLQAATATVTRAPAGTAGEVAAALQRASESFSLVFAAEMAIKLWAYGPWSYARRVVDAADGLIAVSGVAVLVARAAGAAEGCVAAPWSSAEAACERARLALVLVQALRVLRVLRLLRPFWQPVLALRRTAPLLLRIAVVLAIASYSLSAVGMELYAGALSPFHARAHHVLLSSYGKAGFWSINYATFPGALLASLWLALNTKAPMLYEGVMASEDSWAPLAFFVVAYGALVLAFLPVAQAFVIRGFQSHLSMIARRDAGMVEAWEHLTASAQARMFAERPAVFGAPQRWVLSLPERFSRVGEVMFGASLRVEFEGHASLRPVAEAVDAVSRAEDAATEASDAAKRAEAAGTPAPPGALGPPDVRSAAELLVHLSVDKERAVSLAASMQKRLGIRTRTMAPAEAAAAAAAEAAAGTSGAGEDGDAAGSGGEAAATAAGAAGRGEAVPSGPGAGLHSRRETAPRVVGMPSASERGGAALATPVGGLGPRGRAGGGFAFGGDDGSSDGGPSAAAALVGAGSDGSDDGRSSAGGAASAPPGLGKTAVTPARGSLPSSERRFRAAATPAHPRFENPPAFPLEASSFVMSGIRPPVTASPIERAMWTIKTSFLQLLVRMSSNIKPSWLAAALSHGVMGIQMLSFGLSEVSNAAHLGPITAVPTVASFLSFVNPMLIRQYWGTGPWLAIVVIALVWAALLVVSLAFLVITIARTKSPPNSLLLRLYRTLAASTLSWGFIPLLGVLLQAISCENDRWFGVPSATCFGSVHAPVATGIAISLPMILLTTFSLAMVFFDKDPVSGTLDAASHGRGHVLTIIARTALVFVFAFAGGPENVWVRIITIAAAALVWLWVHLNLVPYASTPLNCAHIGTASAVLWVAVSAGIAWMAGGSQDVGLLTLLGAPVAGLLGVTIAHVHFARVVSKEDPYSVSGLFHVVLWTRHRLRLASTIRLRSEAAASASARAAAKGVAGTRPGAIMAAGLAGADGEAGVMSAAAAIEKAATTGIEALEDMFPQSGIGHAIASSFYASTSQLSHYKERQALTLSRAMSSAFDIEFLFFSALYALQDGSGQGRERKGAGRNVISVVDRALFLQHKRLALESQARCYQVHIKLMNHVASREMDVGYLHSELGSQLDSAMRAARDNFDSMLRLNPDSPQALSLAAEFHAELGGNLQRAMDLLSRARRIEEQTRRLKNKKIPHVPFGGLCDDADVSATDEGNAMFTISTDRSRLGEIVSVNQAALRMFGSSMLLGANISVITPSPIAEYHNLFLERFVQTGVSSFLDSTRFMLAQHASAHVFPVRFRLYETPPSAQDMRPKLTGVIQPVQTDEGFIIVGDESLEFCITAVCTKTADTVGRSAEELGRGTVPAALLFPELFGTAGQGGLVDTDAPTGMRGRDASVMGRSILSKKNKLQPPGSMVSRDMRSMTGKSKRATHLSHREGDMQRWANQLPTRFSQALVKPTKVRLFIPAVIEGEDEDAEQQEALDALIDEAESGSDVDSTGVMDGEQDEDDGHHKGAGARVAASLRAKGAKRHETTSIEVSVRIYIMPRPGPEHAGGVALSWSVVTGGVQSERPKHGSEPSKPASAHAKTPGAQKPRVRLAVPSDSDDTAAGGLGATTDPHGPGSASGVGTGAGAAAAAGGGLRSAVGISAAGRQVSLRVPRPSESGDGSKRSMSKRNAADRYRSMTGMDAEAPGDDKNTFVSGMSKSSATKRSLKRSLDTMAKSRNLGIERLRAMLWFAVAAFSTLAIVTMAALGPWATRIELHALSIDAIGQTVQLVEDINYNVGLLATESEIAPKLWPVSNMSANLFRMDALPRIFSQTTQTMYSQLRSLGGPVLAFMIKDDSVTLDVIQSSSAFSRNGGASSRRLGAANENLPAAGQVATTSQFAPTPFRVPAEDAPTWAGAPLRVWDYVFGWRAANRWMPAPDRAAGEVAPPSSSRQLAGGVGVPDAPSTGLVAATKTQTMSGFDALGAVQAATEALRRMTRAQIQVGVPDVDFLRTNAQSRLTPTLNSTVTTKFISLVAELEFISDVELWTAVTAVAFSVICQLIGSVAAAQRMHSEEVILLRVFYHIPIDIAQGLVHKAEARLRKHRKSAIRTGADADGEGDGGGRGNGLIGQGEAGGGGGGTDAGSDDSEERRVEDEEDMKWQLILDKHSNATRFRQMDEATASRNRRTASKSDDEAPLLDDTDIAGHKLAEEAHRDAMARTKDVIVSDSKNLRQMQVGLTIVPSIIIVAWFLSIFIIEGQFHQDVVHNAERVVHMRELTTSTSAHTYSIATAAMLYNNNLTKQLAAASLGQSQRDRILFRMNRALHGGHSALGDELIASGHTMVFDLAPTKETTPEYEILVRNACPALVKGLNSPLSFYAGSPAATLEACEAAHDGIFAQGLRTAIMRYLSRSQSLESSVRHRVELGREIIAANTSAALNITELRQTYASVDQTVDVLARDLLTLFDPWLRAAVDRLASQYADRLPRLISSTWELERNLTIAFAVALLTILVVFLLPRMRWYERIVAATRRMLLVIPDDVLSVVPTLTTAILMLESSSMISDGRSSKANGKAEAIKKARRKADREAARLLRRHKHKRPTDGDAKKLPTALSGASLATADVDGATSMGSSAKVLPTPNGEVMTLDERHSSIVGTLADGSVPARSLGDLPAVRAADPGPVDSAAAALPAQRPSGPPPRRATSKRGLGDAEAKSAPASEPAAMAEDDDLFG